MRSLRMRTTMLLSLLLVAVAMTIVFLILVRLTVERQLHDDLEEDTQRSVVTFANLQEQRRHLLERTAALMSNLPSLKALLTAHDKRTIADEGAEFWRVSGSSLFALSDQNGNLVSFYNDGAPLEAVSVQESIAQSVAHPGTPHLLAASKRLLEVLSEPTEFGGEEAGFRLGYVTVGYSLDHEMAVEVGAAAAAQVAFIGGEGVIVSTLNPSLSGAVGQFALRDTKSAAADIWLGKEHFLGRTIPLNSFTGKGGPYLLVLKSYDHTAHTLRQINVGLALIGVFGLLVGSALAASIASTVTRPLESLVDGTRALGAGNFSFRWHESGALEVRELTIAFRRMQSEIERTQRDLLLAERMATIGRMASSISHDLRHYLTSMYANAEFLSTEGKSAIVREEMLDEVKSAVTGMTEMLDSLLIFGRTGMALQIRVVDLGEVVERAVARVRTHPDARSVKILFDAEDIDQVAADPQEVDRAVYNLLLNGCQAARRSNPQPRLLVTVTQSHEGLRVAVEDNGQGVPVGIRETLFQPFVSDGKENGTGLGLALSSRIVEAHGGSLRLQESEPGKTVFYLVLPLRGVGNGTIKSKHLEGKL